MSKNKSKNSQSSFCGPSTRRVSVQRDHAIKFAVTLGVLLLVTIAFGALANRNQNVRPSTEPPAVAPDATPQYAAASPATEYIYAGGKLLAVSQASQPVPADLAIWRPSTGAWWVLGGTGSAQTTEDWGTSGDVPVPGDYDGDGKTDFSVFRPSSGQWYVLNSGDHSSSVWAWGISTDRLAQADYDGDGKTDRAVWRASDGTWYIVRSSDGSMVFQNYGLSGDTPAPADYDGDTRADIAVWRPQNTTFYSINSSNGAMQTVALNQSGTVPVSADYDGDGRADHAVKSGSNWIIRKSSNTQTETIAWQQASDIPVHNDYDGDGKVDIAAWRNSNGNWYIRQSSLVGQSGELRQVAWGLAGDIPVPAFYRR
jgi:hypothetical protein